MIETAGSPGFGLEASDEVRVARAGARQRLDRDVASQPRIVGAIDLAHAAGADQAVDLVRAEPRARRERVVHAAAL
jgi:hypothetical protein